ncbi:MAG: 3-dehydroquinate synthase [Clostridiales bacterium]|jgi:3-dehydroquinate synthase|nr:3-dehydroquinate synthase [Clostridiales bacterium]
MDELRVSTEYPYPIYCARDFDGLGAALVKAGLKGRRACVVSDANVADIYLNALLGQLEPVAELSHIEFAPGESSKNLDTIAEFYRFFIERRLDRQAVVIALGGGVTGDMAGFAAATYMRGVAYVQVPTSLLAQVDSSVGGKTGVDFTGHKNIVGAFYQPALVYINVNTLKTLPAREFSSGMGEVIKHGLIGGADYFRFIRERRGSIRALEEDALAEMVLGSCAIKAGVVSRDEKEFGPRAILNFGHTFGHAIESLSGFRLPHGHCVALGMCAALHICAGQAGIDKDQVFELLTYFGLPVNLGGCADFSACDVYNQMTMDKKNSGGAINAVMLRALGEAYVERGLAQAVILDALARIGVGT